MPRIYVDTELRTGAPCELPTAAAHHVRSVLRLGPGAEVVLFNGSGGEFEASLTAVTRSGVSALVGARREGAPESPLATVLVQAISRGERMDYTVQKAVELGVQRIVPVVSRRTVVRLDAAREDKRLQHWRGIVRHAAEQSGRTIVPAVDAVCSLPAWLAANGAIRHYWLDPRAPLSLAAQPKPPATVAIVAGPEGGFEESETALLAAAGATPVRLGPRTLRTETAAHCALAVMQVLWGDLA